MWIKFIFHWYILIQKYHFNECRLSMELYDNALHLPSPLRSWGHLGKAYHQLAWPHQGRWELVAQLLPQPELSSCLWLQETLGLALVPPSLNSLSTKKLTIPLPFPLIFGQKMRKPILPLSLPFALSNSVSWAHGSVLCETCYKEREFLLCCPPLTFSTCQST